MRCLNSWVVKRRAGNFQFVPLLSQAAFLSLSLYTLIVLAEGPVWSNNVSSEMCEARERAEEKVCAACTQEICVQGVFLCKCARGTHSHLYKNKLRASFLL
jgi:hypothetical protein